MASQKIHNDLRVYKMLSYEHLPPSLKFDDNPDFKSILEK